MYKIAALEFYPFKTRFKVVSIFGKKLELVTVKQ